MDTFIPSSQIKYRWLKKEVNLLGVISRSSSHKMVKPIQEWLCYHGFKTGFATKFEDEIFYNTQ